MASGDRATCHARWHALAVPRVRGASSNTILGIRSLFENWFPRGMISRYPTRLVPVIWDIKGVVCVGQEKKGVAGLMTRCLDGSIINIVEMRRIGSYIIRIWSTP
jgi:hypothetical protein